MRRFDTWRYPDWQPLYQAAILEPDAKKIGHCIWLAQTAIADRLRALSKTTPDQAEKLAIDNALHVLDVLTQIYGFAVQRSSRLNSGPQEETPTLKP